MNIWLRRIFFLITIILFFIIAPLLLFYAAGWRYNLETKRLEKVGAITIETEPRGASVFLNENLLNKKTPLTIKNLLADQYHLTVHKNGYYQWSRDITVEQSQTTHVPLIYLLKMQSSLQPIIQQPLKIITQSPDRKKIAIYEENTLKIIELDNLEPVSENLMNTKIQKLYWSSSSDKIICSLENGSFTLIDPISVENEIALSKLFNIQLSEIQWSQEESDIIYASTGSKEFYRLNIFQKTATFLFSNRNIIYVVDNLFFDQHEENVKILNSDGELINSINFPQDAELEFLPLLDDYLPILDKNNQTAYFYNINTNDFEKLDETIQNIYWNDNKNRILFYNNHEIWNWDRETATKELIIRTSEEIINASWLIDEYYTLYALKENSLKITETLGTQKNICTIPLTNVSRIFTGADNKTAYVLAGQLLYELKFD